MNHPNRPLSSRDRDRRAVHDGSPRPAWRDASNLPRGSWDFTAARAPADAPLRDLSEYARDFARLGRELSIAGRRVDDALDRAEGMYEAIADRRRAFTTARMAREADIDDAREAALTTARRILADLGQIVADMRATEHTK